MANIIVDSSHIETQDIVMQETAKRVDAPPGEKAEIAADAQSRPEEKDGPKRIRWDIKRSSYEITYEDEEGASRRTIVGLKVKLKTRDNKDVPAEEVKKRMDRAFEKAKLKWNELDDSKRPRFKTESPGSP